jgi:hypothetical protein
VVSALICIELAPIWRRNLFVTARQASKRPIA